MSINFNTKKTEKEFNKINSSFLDKIKRMFKRGIEFLTQPDKILRNNKGLRIKYKKYRIFYKIKKDVVIITSVGQKDKKAYKGI